MMKQKTEGGKEETPELKSRSVQKRKWNTIMREDESSSEEDDIEICPVCASKNDPTTSDNKNRLIGCDGCDKWFHWSCVGVNHDNKPAKDEDWFCKKCSAKKNEASEWKPAKTDEPMLEVLPARENVRGTKSETKKSIPNNGGSRGRGRGRGRSRGGSKSAPAQKSLRKDSLSPMPEVILSPVQQVQNSKRKKTDSKVVVDLFGSKNVSDDEPIILNSSTQQRSASKSKSIERSSPTSRASPAPSSRGISLNTKGDDLAALHIPSGLSLTPVSVKMRNINTAGNTIVVDTDKSKFSKITMDTGGSDSDDSDDLQNSTVSSSGPDSQDKSDDVLLEQIVNTKEKLDKNSTGRVTPLKLNLKQLNSDKESGKKRKNKVNEDHSSKRPRTKSDLGTSDSPEKGVLTVDTDTMSTPGLTVLSNEAEEDDRMSVVASIGDLAPASSHTLENLVTELEIMYPEQFNNKTIQEKHNSGKKEKGKSSKISKVGKKQSDQEETNKGTKEVQAEPSTIPTNKTTIDGITLPDSDQKHCRVEEQKNIEDSEDVPVNNEGVVDEEDQRKKIDEIQKELEDFGKGLERSTEDLNPARKKHEYSWTKSPTPDREQSLEDHMYFKTGTAASGQHRLPQVVEEPSSFSKVQALIQQSGGQNDKICSTSANTSSSTAHFAASLSTSSTSSTSSQNQNMTSGIPKSFDGNVLMNNSTPNNPSGVSVAGVKCNDSSHTGNVVVGGTSASISSLIPPGIKLTGASSRSVGAAAISIREERNSQTRSSSEAPSLPTGSHLPPGLKIIGSGRQASSDASALTPPAPSERSGMHQENSNNFQATSRFNEPITVQASANLSMPPKQYQLSGIRISKPGGNDPSVVGGTGSIAVSSVGITSPVAGVNSITASSTNARANPYVSSLLPTGISISGKPQQDCSVRSIEVLPGQSVPPASTAQQPPGALSGAAVAAVGAVQSSVVSPPPTPVQSRQPPAGVVIVNRTPLGLGSGPMTPVVSVSSRAGQTAMPDARPVQTTNNSVTPTKTTASSASTGYLYPLNSRLGPPVVAPKVTESIPIETSVSNISQPASASRSNSITGARIQVASGLQTGSAIQGTANIHSEQSESVDNLPRQLQLVDSQMLGNTMTIQAPALVNNIRQPQPPVAVQQVALQHQPTNISTVMNPALRQQQPYPPHQQPPDVANPGQPRGSMRGQNRGRGGTPSIRGQQMVRMRGPRPPRGSGVRQPPPPGIRGPAGRGGRVRMRVMRGGVRQPRPTGVPGQVRPGHNSMRMPGPRPGQGQPMSSPMQAVPSQVAPVLAHQGQAYQVQAQAPSQSQQNHQLQQSYQQQQIANQQQQSLQQQQSHQQQQSYQQQQGHQQQQSHQQQQIANHQARYYNQTTQSQPPPPARPDDPPVIKIEDDEDEIVEIPVEKSAPSPCRKKTLDRLKQIGGLTIVRKEAPKVPKNLNLPPGISVSPAVESSSGSGSRSSGSSSTQQVTLNVTEEQKEWLRKQGIL